MHHSEEYRATEAWPYQISCGGAVYRLVEGMVEYALLYRGARFPGNEDTWHLPKGTLTRSETLEACAVREIREESGLEVVVEGYLGSKHAVWNHPRSGMLNDSTRHYFLCRMVGGNEEAMDEEHERVDWCAVEKAIAQLIQSPKQENEIICRAEELRILLEKKVTGL